MVALDVLGDVHQRDAYATLALGDRLNRNTALQPRDKRLVTELVYGTLENRIRLDYMLDHYLERAELEPVVRDILRLGAYQLFFLDRVPGSAAVDESVKLTRAKQREPFTGLVNAVLRTMIREPERVTYPDFAQEPARSISLTHSLPLWLAERLIAAYGPETTQDIAGYRPETPFVTVRRTAEHITAEAFEAYLNRRHLAFSPGMAPGAYRIERPGDLTEEPEYKQGLFSIQGESSMLAALAVGVQPGWAVLDACAAPGGKTALLAETLRGSGRVHAWDVHAHRVELLRSMAKRLRLDNVRPALRDATVLREDLIGTMDAVLLDAPCTGTGVVLDKPDIKYRQTPESIVELTELQGKLLETCARYVRPGGVLVYSTCSILPEENAAQVASFLEKHPEFVPQGLAETMPEALRTRVVDSQVQLLPHRDDAEGFFIARMVRCDG